MIRNAARSSAAVEKKLKRNSGHKVCFYFNALGFHPAKGISYPSGINARLRLSAHMLFPGPFAFVHQTQGTLCHHFLLRFYILT